MAENGAAMHDGYVALARGAWEQARACFEAAAQQRETPEALEGLATAAEWLADLATTLEARQRAYQLYRERQDPRGAARMAGTLAHTYLAYSGEVAVANGWLQLARRLLAGLDLCEEHGWLALWEGYQALAYLSDPATARQRSAAAAAVGRALGMPDLEMLALALEGLAMVDEGDVAEGMRRVDEAMAAVLGGELRNLNAICDTCCFLLTACEAVGDYDRAVQWCHRLKSLCTSWGLRSPFAVCRTYYAGVLLWRGAWAEAEAELLAATRILEPTMPDDARGGLARLGELRRRQGRFDQAEALLRRAEPHPLALLGRAAIALDQGDATSAADLAERYLRRISLQHRADRGPGLELRVRALVALGDLQGAAAASAELQALAQRVGTAPLHAAARFAGGLLAAAAVDYVGARRLLEDAGDLFERGPAPFEAARVRIELARVLQALGRDTAAAQEAATALQALQRLGAAWEAGRAAALLREVGATPAAGAGTTPRSARLTSRELDVLRLLAAGLSNQEIAQQLVLSVRTVERHIANLYAKIGAHSRAGAIAYAFHYRLVEPSPQPPAANLHGSPAGAPLRTFRHEPPPKIRTSTDGSDPSVR
jgi:DNA-binding CsgD family transcriptional regulator/tetratricopeptide (TPR) repeat protein